MNMQKFFLESIWRPIQKLLDDGSPTMAVSILLLVSVVLLPVVVLISLLLTIRILSKMLLVLQSWIATMSGILLDLGNVFSLAALLY
jgi:hypothetical protein